MATVATPHWPVAVAPLLAALDATPPAARAQLAAGLPDALRSLSLTGALAGSSSKPSNASSSPSAAGVALER